MGYESFVNGAASTTLNGSVTPTDTTIVVASGAVFGSSTFFRVLIDSEVVRVGSVSGNSLLTCTRGVDGTASSTHSSGSTVEFDVTPGGIDQFRADTASSGTFSNRPATGKTGAAYLSTDGPILSIWNGSAWANLGPIFQTTLPDMSGFAWINQGGATESTARGSVYLTAPANASDALRIRKTSIPGSPYTVELGLLVNATSDDFWGAGIVLRESLSGKLVTWHYGYSAGGGGLILAMQKWDDENTFNASYGIVAAHLPVKAVFIKIVDDGSNRTGYYSSDRINWQAVLSSGRTNFITPDEIGFFANSNNASNSCEADVFHWKVN